MQEGNRADPLRVKSGAFCFSMCCGHAGPQSAAFEARTVARLTALLVRPL